MAGDLRGDTAPLEFRPPLQHPRRIFPGARPTSVMANEFSPSSRQNPVHAPEENTLYFDCYVAVGRVAKPESKLDILLEPEPLGDAIVSFLIVQNQVYN